MLGSIRKFSSPIYSLILVIPLLIPINVVALGSGIFYMGEEVVRKDKYIVNGDTCQVRNPGSHVAQRLRRINGSLKNTHEDAKATVFCPISQMFSPNNQSAGRVIQYKLQVAFLNAHNHSQEYRCEVAVTSELGEGSWPIAIEGPSTIRKALTIDSEVEGSISFERRSPALTAIFLDWGGENSSVSYLSRPVLQCALLPLSEIKWVAIEQQVRLLHFGTP